MAALTAALTAALRSQGGSAMPVAAKSHARGLFHGYVQLSPDDDAAECIVAQVKKARSWRPR